MAAVEWRRDSVVLVASTDVSVSDSEIVVGAVVEFCEVPAWSYVSTSFVALSSSVDV